MAIATHSTVVAAFNHRDDAETAVAELRSAGYRPETIGAVTRATDANAVEDDESRAGEGAALGAITGASLGALIGMGVVAGVIPVVGPAIAAGTLGTILTNAAGGAAAAGLAGALVGWGVPEDEAHYYETELHSGRTIVTVRSDDHSEEVRSILRRHGGYDMSSSTDQTVQRRGV
jgi:hypothetical protein